MVRDSHDIAEFRVNWGGCLPVKEIYTMAAQKPRSGDGPIEVAKEGRGIVMRIPVDGGGRLVIELNAEEAAELGAALNAVVS